MAYLFCHLCTIFYYPGDIKIWGWYELHVGSSLIFHTLSQDSVGEIQWNLIILIGEILGACALAASLDRFPRFACDLDHPKPSLSRQAFSTTMLDVGVMDTFDEIKMVSVNPHPYWP